MIRTQIKMFFELLTINCVLFKKNIRVFENISKKRRSAEPYAKQWKRDENSSIFFGYLYPAYISRIKR